MNLSVGKRYATRSGALVEVIDRTDTGLMTYSMNGKPLGHAWLIKCRIIRCADGSEAAFDRPREFAVFDDGFYGNADHELDLISEVLERRAA